MKIDDPNEDFQSIVLRRLDALEKARPVGFTDVSRGALKITSVEGLIVEGSAKVSGTLVVTGVQNVDGTLTITGSLITSGDTFLGGPVTIAGATEITGDTTINGSTEINGDTDVNGQLDLAGTLNVTGGGKIQAGVVVIDGTSGGRVASTSNLALVAGGGGSAEVVVTGGFHASNGSLFEGNVFMLQSLNVVEAAEFLAGVSMPNLPTMAVAGAPAGLLAVTPSGDLRVTT